MSKLWLNSAQTGNIKQIKIMHQQMKYLDLEWATKLNQTALMLASANGNLELVKFLIEIGANVSHEDKKGENALSLSIWRNHREVAVLLYKSGCRLNEEVWEEMGETETQLYEELGKLARWSDLRNFLTFAYLTRNNFKLI